MIIAHLLHGPIRGSALTGTWGFITSLGQWGLDPSQHPLHWKQDTGLGLRFMGAQTGRAGNKGSDSSCHYVLSFLTVAWLWFLLLFFIACFLFEERFSPVLQNRSTDIWRYKEPRGFRPLCCRDLTAEVLESETIINSSSSYFIASRNYLLSGKRAVCSWSLKWQLVSAEKY